MRDETQCHNLLWIVCTEMLSTENLFSMINQSTNLVFPTRKCSYIIDTTVWIEINSISLHLIYLWI